MCGIFGFTYKGDGGEEKVQELFWRLKHRGPDAQGSKNFGHIVLGHTRLKIIDLSDEANQPMTVSCGPYWIVYNGEVYNHRSLRERLEKQGHHFQSRSDTEVILHLYHEMGIDCVKELKGMFAFGLYDATQGRLYLCRDRFGIKPLYYAYDGHHVAFASEIQALRVFPWIDFSIREQAIHDFLALRYVPPPETFYRGVFALLPGEYLEVDIHEEPRIIRQEQYHTWNPLIQKDLSYEACVEKTMNLLESAVASELESDVALGSFLSGGIDSSLLAYFAHKRSGNLKTFTIRFPHPRYDESDDALRVALTIGTDHTTLDMAHGVQTLEDIISLLKAYGQPFADASLFGVHAVCRETRRHVTVALSGDGGDEGFAGYDAYRTLFTYARLSRFPSFLYHPIRMMSSFFSTVEKTQRWDLIIRKDPVGIIERQFRALQEPELQALCRFQPEFPVRRWFEPTWSWGNLDKRSFLNRLMTTAIEANIRITLPGDYLVKVDIASMQESLEVRVPFLYDDFFSWALTIPFHYKVQPNEGKRLLRDIARKIFPPSIAQKRKHGFGVPLSLWFHGKIKKELESLLTGSTSLKMFLHSRVYVPWVHQFCHEHGQKVQKGLHLKILLLLSLSLFLDGTEA